VIKRLKPMSWSMISAVFTDFVGRLSVNWTVSTKIGYSIGQENPAFSSWKTLKFCFLGFRKVLDNIVAKSARILDLVDRLLFVRCVCQKSRPSQVVCFICAACHRRRPSLRSLSWQHCSVSRPTSSSPDRRTRFITIVDVIMKIKITQWIWGSAMSN